MSTQGLPFDLEVNSDVLIFDRPGPSVSVHSLPGSPGHSPGGGALVRYTHYQRLTRNTGQVQNIAFVDGFLKSTIDKLPEDGSLSELQALRFVNEWNRSAQLWSPNFMYWIE
jgi:hypothetical protein